ncbi:helix-turn-helix transcriptional regulator [Olsenella sp. DSM 107455]|uniref:Helix-turn-helix transcriptional regulator n=1 Tax=Thermophilibacter gallinarum TaxID=2779357 RepID=A0ABR9QT33_9ACTN|nr:helix-turn-helix transcriptional regulator [Thermophilibacter gallinarum]MBE5024243.1 helix-turn-helix transcriptional regulator [Thermophilibacter gallinarum]
MAEELQSARQVVGERVRERREASGLTQAELAQRIYVSRQTVNNWETGKTLIDVQSLTLVASELGTSASELLGEHGLAAVRAEAESRHELVRLLLRAALAYAVFFVATVAFFYATWLLDWDTSTGRGLYLLASFLRLFACFWSGACDARVTRYMREHDLADATRLWAFLEGRDPEDALPNDFLYRTFLPMRRFWMSLAAIVQLLLLCLPMMPFA